MGIGASLVLAALGAGSVGLVEAMEVLLGAGLHPDLPSALALVVLSVLSTAAPGALVGATLWLVRPLRRLGGMLYLLSGVAAVMAASLAVIWFSDPPPFQDPFPLQGNPLAFAVVGLGVPAGLTWAVASLSRRSPWAWRGALGALVLAGLVRVGLALPAPQPQAPAADRPSVLLVSIDTARADRFDTDTPAFQGLASQGVRFDAAMAQIPVTGPSHATLLTGVTPWEHGMMLNGAALPSDHTVLAELLSAQGYATGAFVSAYVLNGNLGFHRGFTVYDDDFGAVKGLSKVLPGRAWAMVRRRVDQDHLLERRGDRTVGDALRWLEKQEGPWMAWVHVFDPHGPYEPPPPFDERYYRGRDPRDPQNHSMEAVSGVAPYLLPHLEGITDVDYVRARYDGEVAWSDTQLARLLEWLDASGQADSTLVVVAGDHGEGLGEHGEWFNHGDWLYDHDLHVPLAMRFPGRIEAGRVVPYPAELTDVVPTIVDYLELPPAQGVTGVSLRPAIEGTGHPRLVSRALCFDRQANRKAREEQPDLAPTWRMASVRGLEQRYILREHPDFEDIFQELGEGTSDQQLQELLRDQAGMLLQAAGQSEAPDLGAGDAEMLEALGYTEG